MGPTLEFRQGRRHVGLAIDKWISRHLFRERPQGLQRLGATAATSIPAISTKLEALAVELKANS
jgi:hypothetical protein